MGKTITARVCILIWNQYTFEQVNRCNSILFRLPTRALLHRRVKLLVANLPTPRQRKAHRTQSRKSHIPHRHHDPQPKRHQEPSRLPSTRLGHTTVLGLFHSFRLTEPWTWALLVKRADRRDKAVVRGFQARQTIKARQVLDRPPRFYPTWVFEDAVALIVFGLLRRVWGRRRGLDLAIKPVKALHLVAPPFEHRTVGLEFVQGDAEAARLGWGGGRSDSVLSERVWMDVLFRLCARR